MKISSFATGLSYVRLLEVITLELTLIRHAHSQGDVDRVVKGGRMEDALSDKGMKQLGLLKERLVEKRWQFDLVFVSPQRRARQVAEGVRKATGAELIPGERLKEIDCGDLTGSPFKEAERLYPRPEGGHRSYEPMPGGESVLDQTSRVSSFFMEMLDKHINKKLCIVSHGGTMNVIVRLLYGLPATKPRFPGSTHTLRFADTSISRFSISSSDNIVTWYINDSCHLRGLQE
ncbi:MAG: Phosphoglycerate mutase [Thermotogales bacterium 46_20]|nr:MAG: Phosphoglycerate mutase [Thermotogales bacterium 46_20]